MGRKSKQSGQNYTCAMCGNTYTKAITDEEAMEETRSYWPGITVEQCAVVCDDCWEKMSPENNVAAYVASLYELGISND